MKSSVRLDLKARWDKDQSKHDKSDWQPLASATAHGLRYFIQCVGWFILDELHAASCLSHDERVLNMKMYDREDSSCAMCLPYCCSMHE